MGSLCTVPFAAPLNHCSFVVRRMCSSWAARVPFKFIKSVVSGICNRSLYEYRAAPDHGCNLFDPAGCFVSAALAPAPNLVWFSASECYVQYLMTGKICSFSFDSRDTLDTNSMADDGQVPLGPTTAHLQRCRRSDTTVGNLRQQHLQWHPAAHVGWAIRFTEPLQGRADQMLPYCRRGIGTVTSIHTVVHSSECPLRGAADSS